MALWLAHRYMPDYRGETRRPLDVVGLVLFGSGAALLSWLLEIFGEHQIDATSATVLLALSLSLLAAYVLHARETAHPLLRLALFRVRTFRVSVVGGMPFLLPLLYQLGLGMPAWQSGLLMMPVAAAAMGMKLIASRVLARFGYRRVLTANTVMIGVVVCLFSLVTPATPIVLIVLLGLAMGFFNSLQYTSMNSMAYADTPDSSMASTISSSMQQMSMSFGLAYGSLVAGWYLGDLPQTDRAAVATALHYAFLTLGAFTMLSSLSFWSLRPQDGESVSRGVVRETV